MGVLRTVFPNMMEEASHMDVMFLGKGVKFLLDGFPILAVLHGLYEEGTEFWVLVMIRSQFVDYLIFHSVIRCGHSLASRKPRTSGKYHRRNTGTRQNRHRRHGTPLSDSQSANTPK